MRHAHSRNPGSYQGNLRRRGIATLTSAITRAVMDEVTARQNCPLERCYRMVFMDAIRANIRSDDAVRNKAVFVELCREMGDGV